MTGSWYNNVFNLLLFFVTSLLCFASDLFNLFAQELKCLRFKMYFIEAAANVIKIMSDRRKSSRWAEVKHHWHPNSYS